MTLVYVICEGLTETEFMKEVIKPTLPGHITLLTIEVGTPGHRGGCVTFPRTLNSVLPHLRHGGRFVTTFVDLYGLGSGWPLEHGLTSAAMEAHLMEVVQGQMGAKWNPSWFRPHVQPYEFEGLLFSDPAAMARGMYRSDLVSEFEEIRQAFPTPENINGTRKTSPSHRIIDLVSGYKKVVMGTCAALSVGLPAMERECPHFREWLEWLRSRP